MVQRYWEQLTSVSRDMFTLQCWANKHKMLVVEPFLRASRLSFTCSNQDVKTMSKFRDVYDFNYWNALSEKASFMFIRRAPRNLIAVSIEYGAVQQEDPVKKTKGCNNSY